MLYFTATLPRKEATEKALYDIIYMKTLALACRVFQGFDGLRQCYVGRVPVPVKGVGMFWVG